MQLLTKPGDWHQGNFHLGCGHPGKVRRKEKTKSSLFIKESVKVPGIGLGESYMGLLGRSIQQNGYWSKDPEYRLGAVFKGDRQVTSCYVIMEACDTCRMFGDAVYITAPATAVCIHK